MFFSGFKVVLDYILAIQSGTGTPSECNQPLFCLSALASEYQTALYL